MEEMDLSLSGSPEIPSVSEKTNTDPTSLPEYKLNFIGEGKEYFKIIIVNWLLTILTLGIYYPWARARNMQYLFASTTFNGERFMFRGTGKEMFKGLLKVLLVYAVMISILFFGQAWIYTYPVISIICMLFFYLTLLVFIPLVIHGAYRYRMSRTSWRGIRFGYRGNRKELIKKCLKWFFFTLITLGIYNYWMAINLRKYILGNIRFGDVKCKYTGNGTDFFLLNLKAGILLLFTLGIYFFWWQKDLFEYYINNTVLYKDDKSVHLKSTATGWGFCKLLVSNLFLVLLTLGFGFPWATVRMMKFITANITFEGDLDFDTLSQTEENYTDAMGEDAADFFDIDLI
jgi:uncharacterized membrane protein YjgN (DUF898 family)